MRMLPQCCAPRPPPLPLFPPSSLAQVNRACTHLPPRAAAAQRKAEAAAAKQAAREAARAAQQQGRQRAGDKALAAGPQPAVGSNGFRRRLLTRSDIGSGLVGATLHIHWPDDDTWWKGYVEVVDEARCTAIIRYPETGAVT